MWPTWLQIGFQNRANIDEKSIEKSIQNLMHLGIDFLVDFGGFWEGKWRHVGPKIEQKSMPTSKSDFLKNRALPAAGARFSRFWVSNLGVKSNEKSIQKWSQDGKASWHRFLMDFGGFWEPSWGQVGRENRAKTGQDRPRQAKTGQTTNTTAAACQPASHPPPHTTHESSRQQQAAAGSSRAA